ncbi:MAG: ankyrin repeat domain-containing protein [Wolbachia endosymbiont of Xenopsylla cheopis]
MTIDFSNTSNANHSSTSKAEVADIVESIFDDTVHSEVNSAEQKPILSSNYNPSSQLSRQKRQYDPNDINIAKLFTAIREHKTGNPPKDKMEKIKRLLAQIRNINDVDANDHNNTPLHIAVSKGHKDIVNLILTQPNMDLTVRNAQGETAYELTHRLYSSNPSWTNIINQLNQAQLAQPGTSSAGQHGVQQPTRVRETYPASGLKHSLHGNIYQLKLLMLFLHRGLKMKYDFRLATEWDDAEKFDDLVFKYTDQGQNKYRFLQAKHKQDENKKISVGDLFTEQKGGGEFELRKYFISYLKIKNNPTFQVGDLVDFIICTNIGFDLDNSSPTQLKVMKSGKNKNKIISVKAINSNDDFFQQSDGGNRYQLQASNDLIAYLKQDGEVQKIIQAQNIQNIDVEINNFLKKLIFAVNQPNEEKLGKIIGRELGEEFNLIDADLVTDNFQREMLNWMKEKGPKGEEGRFLTPQDGNEFFKFSRQKVNKLKIAGPTSSYSNKLREYNIEFENGKLRKITEFLNQNQNQILNLKSQDSTRLSAIKVNQAVENHNSYKAEDSYIFLSLGGLLRLQHKVLNALNARNSGNLLVIECKESNKINDAQIQILYLYLKQVINLPNNGNKKIVLITRGDNALANAFKSDGQISSKYDEKPDDIGGLSDLIPESQKKMLDKTVNFQGNDTPLGKLINDNQKNLVDGEVLAQLVGGKEIKIGNTVPVIKGNYIERRLVKDGEESTTIDSKAIIVAEPGGGKSSTLIHLMRETKRKNPYLWVVNIDLQSCQKKLKDNQINNKDDAIDFLSQVIKLQNPSEKQLFKNGFNYDNKIALFFDGLDNGKEQKEIIKLLSIIKNTKVTKLLVCSTQELEQLQLPIYTLDVFSREEKIQLLQGYLKEGSKVDIDQTRLESYSQALLEFFVESINDVHIREFTDTPLQMKMLAEAFQDEFKNFYERNEPKPQITEFDLVSLYKKFFDKKFADLKEKLLKEQAPISQSQEAAHLLYKTSLRAHEIFAIEFLFTNEKAKLLFSKGNISNEDVQSYIGKLKEGRYDFGITRSNDGNVQFIHRTFAEYLVARYINNLFQSNKGNSEKIEEIYECLDIVYFKDNVNDIIGNFLDHFLTKNLPLHHAVLVNEKSVEKVLSSNKQYIYNTDILGRTPLHLATNYHDSGIITLLLENGASVNVKDEIFHYSPLTYADINSVFYPEIVELFLKKEANFDDLLYTKSLFNNIGNDERGAFSLLKAAIGENCELLVQNLIDHKMLDFLSYEDALIIVGSKQINDPNSSVKLLFKYFDEKSMTTIGELVRESLDLINSEVPQPRKRHSSQNYYEHFPKTARRSIEAQLNQQQVFIQLEKTIKSIVLNAKIKSVRQGLYLPSFEQRNVKIKGKCAAITRGFSQSLFLEKPHRFLDNLETSAKLYERLASGKQISNREEVVVFAFNKLLDKFEQNIDSPTSSLPSSLSPIKSVKTLSDLSNYITREFIDDFAIHLVISNHVVAIYRKNGVYSYFDSNVALISNLKSPDELINTVNQSVKLAGYEVPAEGFLVERFNVKKANQDFSHEEKEIFTGEIKTERQLLAAQDQELGPIEVNGQKLYRKTLYDMGAKIDLGSGVTNLINSHMNEVKLIQDLKSGKIKLTAREYLEKLKGKSKESIQEIVKATSDISFEGARSEIENANTIRKLVISEDGKKLNSYELNKILKAPMEGSIKTIPYYLEVAKARYQNPGRLTNAAGRISMLRGIHGTLYALQQGDVTEFALGAGEISFSMFSQLIEDKVVIFAPKIIKQMKGGIFVARGIGGLISNPFDIVDLVRSSIDLSKAEKGSKEWRDAIAGVTFSSASIVSSVVFTAAGATGAGTIVGLVIVIGQGFYSGASMVIELKKYQLTTDEEFRVFMHTFLLQSLPKDVEYIAARKEAVKSIVMQAWQNLLSDHKVIAYATGLGGTILTTHKKNCRIVIAQQPRHESNPYEKEICDKVTNQTIAAEHAVIDMFTLSSTSDFSRMISYYHSDKPDSNYHYLCLPECPPPQNGKYIIDCQYGNYKQFRFDIAKYHCLNSVMVGHQSRIKQKKERGRGEGKVVFDLKLVNKGMVRANREWNNEFIIANGTENIYGGSHTNNTFILTELGFNGTIIGGNDATNILATNHLEADTVFYNDQDRVISSKDDTSYTATAHSINAFVGKRNRRERIDCGNKSDMLVDCKGGTDVDHDIIKNCNQVVVYGNTSVEGKGDNCIFNVKPSPGYAKINIKCNEGSIFFSNNILSGDNYNIIYFPERNILHIEEILVNENRQKFTLEVYHYWDNQKHRYAFNLLDKHGSAITPFIDVDQDNGKLQIDTFLLTAERIFSTINEMSDWYKSTYQNKRGYNVYGIIKDSRKGRTRPYSIFGSTKSDIIPLKEVEFAKGGEGTDVYSLPAEDIAKSPYFIEINNEASDKELDILHISTMPQEAKVVGCHLQLYRLSNSYIQIKDYFLNDEHRHLALIDDTMNMFIVLPKEGEESCRKTISRTWKVSDIKQVQLIPFYHASDLKNVYFISEEQVRDHPVIAIDAHLNSASFYRNNDDLLLIGDNISQNKSLIVNLQGFYNNINTSLYFYPNDYQLNIREIAKLAINYQAAQKSEYDGMFKEYSVDLATQSVTIDHGLEKSKVGILTLQNVAPSNIVIENNGNDLIFKYDNNALTFKNWDNHENRISVLKFGEELEIVDINKFSLGQLSDIRLQVKKADLNHAIDQRLERLNSEVINGLKYLFIARNAENVVTGTYKFLGFDSVAEQQLFIASYQPYYNATTLKKILCDDHPNETVKALVLLILKSYLADDKELLQQCFFSLVGEDNVNKIYKQVKFLDAWNSNDLDRLDLLMFKQNIIRLLNQSIISNLASTGAGFQERKRRATNLDEKIKQQEVPAASSATKPSSWISDSFGLIKSFIGGLIGLSLSVKEISNATPQSEFKKDVPNSTTPFDSTGTKQESDYTGWNWNFLQNLFQGFVQDNVNYVDENLKQAHRRQMPIKFEPKSDPILEMGGHYISQVDGNGTLQLLDMLARKVTGAKPLSLKSNDISELDAQGYALDIGKEFEKAINQSANKSSISVKQLQYNLVKIYDEVKEKIIDNKLKEIPEVLKLHAAKALLQKLNNRHLSKFKIEFDKEINARLEPLMQRFMCNATIPNPDKKSVNQKRFKQKLPKDFQIGQSVTDGNCFFDSFRQGLQQQRGITVTSEQLRKICQEFVQQGNLPKWFKDNITNSCDNSGNKRHETVIQYIKNIMDCNRWGNPEVEGRILCQKYNVKLHIAETQNMATGGYIHQIISAAAGPKSVDNVSYRRNMIHMINKGNNHFEPILRRQNREEVQLPNVIHKNKSQDKSAYLPRRTIQDNLNLTNISEPTSNLNNTSVMSGQVRSFL